MPEFDDLNGNRVKMEPAKLTLVSRKVGHAVLRQEGDATRFVGTIEIDCSGEATFAEIVHRLEQSSEALKVIEQITVTAYHQHPFDRLAIVKSLQELYHRLSGWHLTGIPFLKPRSDGVSMMEMRGAGTFKLPEKIKNPADVCIHCISKMTLVELVSEAGRSFALSCPTDGCKNNLLQTRPPDSVKLLPEANR